MADYRSRFKVILQSAPQTIYPPDHIFTGAALNGEEPLELVEVFLADTNDNRSGTPIRFEPGETIAGLSEV